jgi:putative transposase
MSSPSQSTPRRFFDDPAHAHFLTFSCFHRRQFLTGEFARLSLADAIQFARERHDFAVWAYVFMPNHVHMLIYPRRTEYSMSSILRDIKEQPARRVIRHLKANTPWLLKLMRSRQGKRIIHRFWQTGGGFDRNLYSGHLIERAIHYIEWNPVRRGYVATPCDWIWSSARARSGGRNVPLKIDPVLVTLS